MFTMLLICNLLELDIESVRFIEGVRSDVTRGPICTSACVYIVLRAARKVHCYP